MAIKVNRMLNAQERDRKIEEMNIDEIRAFLCMKHGQDPDKCEGCPGLSTCTAGQRVQVLKDMTVRREAEEQAKAAGKPKRKVSERTEKALAYIRLVLTTEDPRQYLMDNEGLDADHARKKLDNWRQRHPELFEGVTIEKRNRGRNWKVSNSLEFYRECMAHEDPVLYYVEQRGCTYNSAQISVKRMKERYGEISMEKAQEQPAETDEEVNVEDFLKEFSEAPEQEPAAVTEAVKPAPSGGIGDELKAKYAELTNRMESVLKEMDRLNAEIAEIETSRKGLEVTARLFGTSLQ